MTSGISRRAFLTRTGRTAGAGLAAGGLGSLLAACGPGALGAPAHHLRLPAPNNPVSWPVRARNRAIAGGLSPERNATLRVFTWTGRVSQQCLDDFATLYRCQVELVTFNTFGQALTALSGQRGTYDVLLGAPSYMIGRMVWKGMIQPLNHGYIPNIRNTWPFFTDPYYDSGWLYSVPYTVYTTGIAWRTDLVDADPYAVDSGWNFPWAVSAGSTRSGMGGRIAVLDDYRQSLALGLLKDGVTDLNTTDPLLIDAAAQSLLGLRAKTGLRVSNSTSRDIASGGTWVHLALSGQVAAAAQYLPRGVRPEVLGYWFPPDGAGPVGNDTGTVLRGARSPVLAHLLLNYLLDNHNALVNIARTGFTQPLSYVTPRRLILEGILPRTLTSTCVLSTYLDHGLKELQLPVAGAQLWEQAWRTVLRQRAG